jgi:hypothetical protein
MDAPAGAARPCEDFWFADGTVVLRSEDTLFKTYIGLLSGISLVFRDMFGVPQPPAQETENYEGLPFVCLSDTAWDITHFLKAIHTPGCVTMTPCSLCEYLMPWTVTRKRTVCSQYSAPSSA